MQTLAQTSAILAAAAFVGLAGAARADLKVVQTTRIDNPQLKAYEESLTPQQRAQMAKGQNPLFASGPQTTTVYIRGTRTRADIGGMTYLVDTATRTSTTINRRNRTYVTRPYRLPANVAGQTTAQVRDLGQTKTISGHPAHHYSMTATFASQPGTILQGDIWAAQDIPQPPLLSGGGPLAALQSQFRKIKGYPLRSNLALTGSPLGNTTINTQVVSVSKTALPASLFAIPAGYAKSSTMEGGGM